MTVVGIYLILDNHIIPLKQAAFKTACKKQFVSLLKQYFAEQRIDTECFFLLEWRTLGIPHTVYLLGPRLKFQRHLLEVHQSRSKETKCVMCVSKCSY